VALALVVVGLGYRFFMLQPTNQGDWEYGMDVLPHVTIHDDRVTVEHERDFRWSADGALSSSYVDRSYDTQQLERVWFVQEPFTIEPFEGFTGVAHTYFVFDFRDQPPLAVSVEARRQRGQKYDAFKGMFNEYGLIYIWGTEQDVSGRRAVLEKQQLYMYPLSGSMDTARRLFLDLARSSQELETQPRFYNSLTSNCTNELAKVANEAQPGVIPLNIALILPGYADQVLYDDELIPHDAPLDAIRERYAVTPAIQANIDQPDFSQRVRDAIARQSSVR
jgi:hypothetical protein